MSTNITIVYLFLVVFGLLLAVERIDQINKNMDAKTRNICFREVNTIKQFYRCYGPR